MNLQIKDELIPGTKHVKYLANIIVKHGFLNNIVALIVNLTVDIFNKESYLIELHAGTKHIDNKNVRHLIYVVLFRLRVCDPSALGPVLKSRAVNSRNLADLREHNAA